MVNQKSRSRTRLLLSCLHPLVCDKKRARERHTHLLSSVRGAIMQRSLSSLLNLYNPSDPLEKAWTIPSPWYFDPGIARLEQESVFANTWQVAGRVHQV